MYLLGITGKKHSGKDTVYQFIKELLPDWRIERIAFADALKEEVAKACGVTVQYIEEHKEIFRPILQWWGTDFRRNLCNKDYWVWKWGYKLNCISDSTFLVVATDVRYLNEAKIITDCGGKIIRVTRTYTIENVTIQDYHTSETEQDAIKADFQILNNGTLNDLRFSVTQCLVDIKQRYMNGNQYINSKDGTKAGVIHSTGM